MKTRRQVNIREKKGKVCDKKNWSEVDLDKRFNIAIDTENVQVLSADGALYKLNQKTQEGKLLFYYRLPAFPSNTKNQHRMLLRATVEIRMNVKTLTTIADCINKHYTAIQNQTTVHKCIESEKTEPPVMFG